MSSVIEHPKDVKELLSKKVEVNQSMSRFIDDAKDFDKTVKETKFKKRKE